MKGSKLDYEKQSNNEIEKRLSIMEKSDYVFAKRFTGKDYIFTLVIVIVCFVFIIAGAFL